MAVLIRLVFNCMLRRVVATVRADTEGGRTRGAGLVSWFMVICGDCGLQSMPRCVASLICFEVAYVCEGLSFSYGSGYKWQLYFLPTLNRSRFLIRLFFFLYLLLQGFAVDR